MLRGLQTAVTVANEVSMLRASMKGAILVVEGDLDVRLYRRFSLPIPHSRAVLCGGKPKLLDAVKILGDRNVKGFVAICDADFDRVLSVTPRENVFYADYHDAEVMIAHSDALEFVIHEAAHGALSADVSEIRNSLVDTAAIIGRVRIWNKDNDARLRFKGVDVGAFLQPDLTFDLRGYLGTVIENSNGPSVDLATLLTASNEYHSQGDGPNMAVGHDFIALLDARIAIDASRERLGEDVLGMMMRLAFDAACFRRTNLSRKLLAWEEKTGFELLADDARPV